MGFKAHKKVIISKRLLFLVCCFILAASAVQAFGKSKRTIRISGDQQFVEHVGECLDLLEEKYPESHTFVNRYIGVISRFHRSGMLAWEKPPIYQMSKKTAYYSITWCASSIAHDAYHSFLYQKHKPSNGGSTPNHYWADFKAEQKAIQYQKRVANKVGSPQHELDYLDTLDGTHADLDGDGVVTNQEYLDRDW